jgi:hypothetical protein
MKRSYLLPAVVAAGLVLAAVAASTRWPSRPGPPAPGEWVIGTDREVDLGEIEAGHGTRTILRLRNPASEEARLIEFRQSCGCVYLEVVTPQGRRQVATEVVPPGGMIEMVASLSTTGMSGHVRQPVYFLFRTASGDKESKLVVAADVVQPMRCDPEHVDLGTVPAGEERVFSVRVTDARGRSHLGPLRASSTSPHVSALGIDPLPESAGSYLLRGKVAIPFGEREVTGRVYVVSESGRELCGAKVRAVCEQAATLTPPLLVFPTADKNEPYKAVLRLSSRAPCDLRLLEAPPGTRVSVTGSTVAVEQTPVTDRVVRGTILFEADFGGGRTQPIRVNLSAFPEAIVPQPG